MADSSGHLPPHLFRRQQFHLRGRTHHHIAMECRVAPSRSLSSSIRSAASLNAATFHTVHGAFPQYYFLVDVAESSEAFQCG